MRTILYLIRKEFLQIFRNKGMLPIILVMPVLQLLVLSYAADFEIRNLKFFWIDKDQSETSRLLRSKLEGSVYFILSGTSFNSEDGAAALNKGATDLALEIPAHFERDLIKNQRNELQLIVNAIDGTKAGLGKHYANEIILDLADELRTKHGRRLTSVSSTSTQQIATTYSFWYNKNLNYKTFMVPGILVMLVTMISAFISAMNIVREREIGTIEQLNVTPIKKHQFIIGKLFPLWIIGLIEFTAGLIIAWLVFGITTSGSLLLLYAYTAIYLTMILGMGMFISTFTDTQQQAMFITWFFIVIFMLMSGLFTAIENMPGWAQNMTLANPMRYFIEVVRLVMLKGSSFWDIRWHILITLLFALGINGLAMWNYKKIT